MIAYGIAGVSAKVVSAYKYGCMLLPTRPTGCRCRRACPNRDEMMDGHTDIDRYT